MSDNLGCWTEQRRQIAAWLDDHAPCFADGYRAAVEMLHTPGFPARVHLVCHVVRDIYRLLPPMLGKNALPRFSEVIPGEVKTLADRWTKFPPVMVPGTESDNDLCTVRMHQAVYDKIAEIVTKSREMAGRQSTIGGVFASALFYSCHRNDNEFIALWVVQAFDAEYKFFVGQAHLNKAHTDEGLAEHFDAFERAFHSLVGSYFMGKEELDTILHDANQDANKMPDQQHVLMALQRIRTAEFAVYFFSRLNNPQWIGAFSRAAVFSAPPPPVEVDGGVHHPNWPASQYLARMANLAPNEVAEVLCDIRTENSSVLRDIVDAANRMPAEIAATLVPAVCSAVEADAFEIVFPKATEFCVTLASNSQEDAALTLSQVLFGLERQPRKGTAGHRDRHWYEEGMKKVVPILTEKRPERFIDTLCKWLGKAIEQEEHYAGPRTRAESSWYWRPAIEEHEQNRHRDFPCAVVGFVRQAYEQAIGNGYMTLEAALSQIEQQPFSVFGRLRIHLVNCFADQAPERARSIMMDRSMLEDDECKHEYALLVGQRFSMLSQEDRAVWFRWIYDGPDMTWYDEYHKRSSTDSESFDVDRQDCILRWQRDRLHWVRDHLDDRHRQLYRELIDKFGEPLFADLNSYHGPVRRGLDSPFTVEDMRSLLFPELVEKVDAWQPESQRRFPDGPQQEGLASTFGQYVAAGVAELSVQAEVLKNRQPIFVRTFIERTTDAINAGAGQIDIGALLRLCVWVVEQPVGHDSDDNGTPWERVDRNWQYTRDSICRFLQTICERASGDAQNNAILECRETVVSLLDCLTRDSAKSYRVEESERKNTQICDFVDFAINSPRGRAMEALVAYARWMAKHLQRKEDDRMVVPNGFTDMPEVRRMLEWQIASENATCESFAVIGTYIGLLHWIDHSWVEDNTSTIFDLAMSESDSTRVHGWAAWNAFLVWGHPNLALFQVLRAQYVYAVKRLPEAVMPENAENTPLHHLGEQLIVLYGRGDLESSNDERLLHQFLEAAPTDVRSQTMAFVGHSLTDGGRLPETIVVRFQRLWDWYWPTLGSTDMKTKPQGGPFGSWFTCKRFPDEWCLERLEQFLEVVPMPDLADRISKRLAELADTHLEAVTRILDREVRANDEAWRAYVWHRPAKTILRAALQSNDTTRRLAIQLIEHLGRRGYVEFGKLLSPGADAGS